MDGFRQGLLGDFRIYNRSRISWRSLLNKKTAKFQKKSKSSRSNAMPRIEIKCIGNVLLVGNHYKPGAG
jgi:hypothetical protein